VGERERAGVVSEVGGKDGEMTQTLYVHMNKIKVKKKHRFQDW
jgi:hypothetical protein